MRWVLFLLLLLPWGLAQEVIRILEAERLEIRTEGEEEVYILVGRPVRLEREGEAIEAARVVYLKAQGRLRLLEGVRYKDREGRLIEAEELLLDLKTEGFEGVEVRLEAKNLLLTGPLCQRAAGAILLERGYATPCKACGHEVPDYAFRAQEIVLYPGDRVVARGVVLLWREEPLLELPALVLFLSERQPRLEFGMDAEGFFFKSALPYVSPWGIGFTLLNYFGGRGYGFGLDHIGLGEAKERYFFLHTPLEAFQYRLQYELRRPMEALLAQVERDDTREKLTRLRLEASREERATPPHTGNWRYALRLEGFLDHDPATPPPRTLQRLPEAEVSAPTFREGPFSLGFGLTLGYYQAETNPLNRSAQALGPYAGAFRGVVTHTETLSLAPWTGGSLGLQNRYRGFFYSTQNPTGEYERQIDWTLEARFRQDLRPFSLEARYLWQTQEGESPFRFDALPFRRTHTLTLGAGYAQRPLELNLQGGLDLEGDKPLPLEARGVYREGGVSLEAYRRQDPGKGPLETRLQLGYTQYPFTFRAQFHQDHLREAPDPLLLQAGYALPLGSLSLLHRHDLSGQGPLETGLDFSYRQGLEAYTLRLSRDWPKGLSALQAQAIWGPESLTLQARLQGDERLDYALAFRSGQVGGPLLEASLTGAFQEGPRGTNLRLSLAQALPEVAFRLLANLHLPEVEDGEIYLKDLTFSGGVEVLKPTPPKEEEPGLPGVSFSGNLSYLRRPTGEGSWNLRNFGPTLTFLGRENSKLHLSFLLSGTHPSAPLQPRFILTLDRCCWALRATVDAERRGFSLAFLVGGRAAGLLLSEEGVNLGVGR